MPKIVSLRKKFESHAMKNKRKNNLKDSQKLGKVKVSVEHEEESFIFCSSEKCVEHQEFIIDSGAKKLHD